MVNRGANRNRGCTVATAEGRLCGSPALRGERYCHMHHPDHASEVAEARRLGGHRRKRVATLSVVYDVDELRTIEGNQRLLEVAAYDTLALENSVARNRTIVAVVTANAKLIEASELTARISALEAALGDERRAGPRPLTALSDRLPGEDAR